MKTKTNKERGRRWKKRKSEAAAAKENAAPSRTIRIPDSLWIHAKEEATKEGKTIAKWIIQLMQTELDRRSSSAQD